MGGKGCVQPSGYRAEWEGGCEDPRLTQREDGVYIMTYTAYDGDKARLMVASSPDLYHWTKHGHAFAKVYDGKYVGKWSKSGSIVSSYAEYENDYDNVIAKKNKW